MGCTCSKRSSLKAGRDHLTHRKVERNIIDLHTSIKEHQCRNNFKDIRSIICNKGIDHNKFIRIADFRIDSLPEQIRSRAYWDFVCLLANLTVKIVVTVVSNRPKVRLRTGSKYPHHDDKNRNLVRVGTGTIVKVVPQEEKEGQGKCPKSYELKVITSRHNVWNQEELKGACVEISFHDEQGIETLSTKLKAESSSEYSVINTDTCSLSFITHDDDLSKRLADLSERFWQAATRELSNSGDFLSIVSHPHGCQKCVSFGKVTNSLLYLTESTTSPLYVLALHLSFSMRSQSDNDLCIAYTTTTCAGCSGALIVYYSKFQDSLRICTHEGYREEDNLNHSGNPEYLKEECLSVCEERSCGLGQRRRYSKNMDEEETKRFGDAKNLTFREKVDYAFLRLDHEMLREVIQSRYGCQIEEKVSHLIHEGDNFFDALLKKDRERLSQFGVPYASRHLEKSPTQLKKERGWIIKQFLSHTLDRLLKELDRF